MAGGGCVLLRFPHRNATLIHAADIFRIKSCAAIVNCSVEMKMDMHLCFVSLICQIAFKWHLFVICQRLMTHPAYTSSDSSLVT